MSMSHLNFQAPSWENGQNNNAKQATRAKIFDEKKQEYFDESKFVNTDDVSKVPGTPLLTLRPRFEAERGA